MKKLIIFLSILASVFCFASCSAVENTSDTVKPVVSNSESKPEIQHKFEITEISETERRIKFYRDYLMIFGVLHLPEGDGPFPVVILSPGMQAPYYTNEQYAEELAQNGIAGLAFEFTGTNNKSDGSFSESSILTHAADLNIVIDVIASLPEVDNGNLFLWGNSFGGLTSAYVATQRPDDIKALVLLEPSIHMPDIYREMFPEGSDIFQNPNLSTLPFSSKFVEDLISVDIFELMPSFENEVLIFKGTEYSPQDEEEQLKFRAALEEGAETFPEAQLVTVEGADHMFLGIFGNRMIRQTIEFLLENID